MSGSRKAVLAIMSMSRDISIQGGHMCVMGVGRQSVIIQRMDELWKASRITNEEVWEAIRCYQEILSKGFIEGLPEEGAWMSKSVQR